MFCVMTALFVPILSAVVLVFTGLRIRATLKRRQAGQIGLHRDASRPSDDADLHRAATARTTSGSCHAVGSRRTLKIITFTSLAYFACYGPYSVTTLAQMIVGSFKPPSGVEFAVMWIAVPDGPGRFLLAGVYDVLLSSTL